jgi:hypothetical protein
VDNLTAAFVVLFEFTVSDVSVTSTYAFGQLHQDEPSFAVCRKETRKSNPQAISS